MDEHALRSVIDSVMREVSACNITLEQARTLSEQIRKKAAEMGVKAVVAIANSAGHPILVESMDDAYIASYDVALQTVGQDCGLYCRIVRQHLDCLSAYSGRTQGKKECG